MHHLAILNPSWKLLDKIINRQKTIESRRYKTRRDPWNKIQAGDTVFFKDAGKPVTLKAQVSKVIQYDHLTDPQRADIVEQYGGIGKICFKGIPQDVVERTKEKTYCILVFLDHPESIKPFEIDKTWYGNACAWICIDDIEKIRKK